MTYNPRWTLNGLDLTSYPFMVAQDSADPGTAETVSSILASQIVDGDVELTQRRGNRTYQLAVFIEGDDRGLIATAQADLVTAAERPLGTLEFDPGDGSDVTVFETFAGTVALSNGTDDMASQQDFPLQRLTLTIPCRPFVRTVNEVTIDAPAVVGSTTTTVDDGSVVTGWSVLETAPAAVVNLETNPDFATNVTGYLAGSGSAAPIWATEDGRTISRVVTAGPGSASGGRSYLNGPLQTVTAGSTVEAGSVVQTGFSPYMTTGVTFRFYSDAAGTVQIGADVTLTGAGGNYATRTWTTTVPAGAIRMRTYRFQQNLSNASFSPWQLDKQWTNLIPAGQSLVGYFDGNTVDTTGVNYSWDGTANNSTSRATWTAPAIASTGGKIQATVYGRSTATARRTGAITMSSLNYIRVRGTASWDTASPKYTGLTVSLADNGGGALATVSSTIDGAGNFDIIAKRPEGFTKLDVTAKATDSTAPLKGVRVAVDSVVITDNPFFTGAVQSRQVPIYGSQRTELSLAILGLNAGGTTPVALGEQVLVHTATAGDDSRSKFLGCRATSNLGGTGDTAAVTGLYSALGTTASPVVFTFQAAMVLPGEYVLFARLKATSTAVRTVYYAGSLDGAGTLDAADPPTGWHSTQITPATTYGIVPLGVLMLPPANVEDPAATISVKLASDTASVVQLDEVWIAHAESGQVTLLNTNDPGISAVRLDAATVDASDPSAWVGVATSSGTGTMMKAGARIQAFDQHMAEPGLLQISTVTPACATSRVSASYFPRYAHDVAPLPA